MSLPNRAWITTNWVTGQATLHFAKGGREQSLELSEYEVTELLGEGVTAVQASIAVRRRKEDALS